MQVKVININGEEVGNIELNDNIWNKKPNLNFLHQVIKAYLTNRRRGTASTKTRGEVSGGGRKPWPQKGTGRARHGSIRSPIWRKGGITFGPKPRDYYIKLPKKMKKLALAQLLSDRLRENKIIILDEWKLTTHKTKDFLKILDTLNIKEKTIIVEDNKNELLKYASSNINYITVISAKNLNPYNVITYNKLVFTKKAIEMIEKRLSALTQ